MHYSTVFFASTALVALLQAPGFVSAAGCSFSPLSISTNPGFKVLETKDNYRLLEDTTAKVKYGLFCDSQPSDVKDVDKWFKVPVTSVGTRVPIASGFLEALKQRNKLAAAAASANLTNPCIDTKKLGTLGDTNTKVDVIFSDNASSDDKLSVRLPSDDGLSPLQLAEWIKFVSAFFQLEKEAGQLFDSISKAYLCLEGNMRNVKQKPHAYWVQYTAGSNGGRNYNVLTSAYQKNLLASAGATNGTSQLPSDQSDQSKFQDAVKDAQFIIDQTDLKSSGQRINEWLSNFGYGDAPNSNVPFLKQRNIWRTDGYTSPTGVSNFPEFGLVRPDLVLRDMISILEPTYDKSYHPQWMWQLGNAAESISTIDTKSYKCDGSWMTAVPECKPRDDFYGDDGNGDSKSDDGKNSGQNNSGKPKSGANTGKIVGGVIGGIMGVMLIVVALHYFNRTRREGRTRALSQTRYSENIALQNTHRYSQV
ncbi:hypothetical protein GGI12_003446 [Dipsacomyces acuminosporus]|nr:hypothetical protein GGI12_003446 [Dipsacomyces acuminosporus]